MREVAIIGAGMIKFGKMPQYAAAKMGGDAGLMALEQAGLAAHLVGADQGLERDVLRPRGRREAPQHVAERQRRRFRVEADQAETEQNDEVDGDDDRGHRQHPRARSQYRPFMFQSSNPLVLPALSIASASWISKTSPLSMSSIPASPPGLVSV